ncbi:MAG: translation initiation factor IF-2 [Planctomycetaceae bacterium]|nr:translation initiation factor IF-2 [Planctomycetaceae bacterium]
MSIRIYALSKLLNVDSKDILDAVRVLGIEGKGSSLATLTDEEVVQIKDKLRSAQNPANSRPQTPDASLLQRPSFSTDKKVLNLDNPLKRPSKFPFSPEQKEEAAENHGNNESTPAAEAARQTDQTDVPEPEIDGGQASSDQSGESVPEIHDVPTPPDTEPETAPRPAAKPLPQPIQPVVREMPVLPPAIGRIELPAKGNSRRHGGKDKKKGSEGQQKGGGKEGQSQRVPQGPPKSTAPIATGYAQLGHASQVRNPDYRGPMRKITDKIPNLDEYRRDDRSSGQTADGRRQTAGIHLAPLPKGASAPQPKSKEPEAMKPDMKLPPELLKKKNVAQSIEEHIKKHEERIRQKEEDRKLRESGKKTAGTGRTVAGTGKSGRDFDDRKKHGKGGHDAADVFTPDKKRRRSGPNRRHNEDDGDVVLPRQLKRQKVHGKSVNTAAPRKGDIVIQLPCTVKQFAEQTGLSLAVVIRKLLEIGMPMTLNSQLDREASELLAEACSISVAVRDQVTLEDKLVSALFEEEEPAEKLRPRPAVVTVLGHVDHGKTTLLDYILHLNVVSGEKGGITQHIRAYRVKMDNGEDITFVDTPGHEAFTEMRARGANCTDIVILVVAADDGVMPQTEEAISHAKAAGVPIVVALNKMDLPGVNPDRVIQEIAQHDLLPSEWGGDVEIVRCSGLTGLGIDKLLETIQVIAELHELRANPDRAAVGTALEAELQAGQGVVCKMLVQKGTLHPGDVVLCGSSYGRVKAMYDTLDTKKVIEEATPSTPVNLVGLDVAPKAGSKFCVLNDISDARIIAEQRLAEERKEDLADVQAHVTLETLFQRMTHAKTVQTLNVIIRADVRGSIEAIRKELGKLDHPEVKIRILQATVGGISEADVMLADASDAVIVGFNVVPDENARLMADHKKIQIRRYDIIYNLTDDIKKALEGMLKPIEQVKELGRAMVQRLFVVSRVGTIAGCRVMSGTIERDCKVRIIRDSRIIGEYPLDSLKREKDDVKEVRDGYECGMKLKGFNDLKEGDVLETYKIEEVARTF